MKRMLRRRPSPALVISLVALFATLGGSAYALTITGANIRNNSVSGAKLRDNSVPATKKLRNRTLTGGKVKPRSLQGRLMQADSVGPNAVKEQVLDATKLGKVKEAASADAVGGLTAHRVPAVTLDLNEARTLFTAGPFTVIARCRVDGSDHVAEIVVQTNQNHSAIDGGADDPAGNDPDFNVGEVVALVSASGPAGTPAFDQASSGAAIAPDGTELVGQELYAGTSMLDQPSKCRFGGVIWAG